MKLIFPKDFVWGSATASYQIEGAINEDGRGQTIWDTFSHTPGKISDGTNGDIACDHYHRYKEDVALMRELQFKAYRFSVAWSRILPQGRGQVNQAGLDFYNRLVDTLLASNITPYLTLYHWDLPQALQDEGGWLRRGIIEDYLEYADIVSQSLGDRVKHWTTFNEPWVFSWEGHYSGEDAPGLKLGAKGALATTHHALLAHGQAVPLIRSNVKDAQVGIVLDMNDVEPATQNSEDIAAAKRFEGCQNRWYLDAVFRGRYPEDMLELYRNELPEIRPGDLEAICVPLDYLGVNFYRRSVMANGTDLAPVNIKRISPEGSEYTEMGWEVSPRGLYNILKFVHDNYNPKILYVTENGAAFTDVLHEGKVQDLRRVSYLREHLAQLSQAIEDGIPLKGYFVWSFFDNFEWAYGYSKRFGIVHVDYKTQQRTIKDSGYFLSEVIKENSD